MNPERTHILCSQAWALGLEPSEIIYHWSLADGWQNNLLITSVNLTVLVDSNSITTVLYIVETGEFNKSNGQLQFLFERIFTTLI